MRMIKVLKKDAIRLGGGTENALAIILGTTRQNLNNNPSEYLSELMAWRALHLIKDIPHEIKKPSKPNKQQETLDKLWKAGFRPSDNLK